MIGLGGFAFYLSAIMAAYNWLGNEIVYKVNSSISF